MLPSWPQHPQRAVPAPPEHLGQGDPSLCGPRQDVGVRVGDNPGVREDLGEGEALLRDLAQELQVGRRAGAAGVQVRGSQNACKTRSRAAGGALQPLAIAAGHGKKMVWSPCE